MYASVTIDFQPTTYKFQKTTKTTLKLNSVGKLKCLDTYMYAF